MPHGILSAQSGVRGARPLSTAAASFATLPPSIQKILCCAAWQPTATPPS